MKQTQYNNCAPVLFGNFSKDEQYFSKEQFIILTNITFLYTIECQFNMN